VSVDKTIVPLVTPGTSLREPRVEVLSKADLFSWLGSVMQGHRVLLVASIGSVRRLHLEQQWRVATAWYSSFESNPTVSQSLAAACCRETAGADRIVAIGGGSAMDVAKAAGVLSADSLTAFAEIDGSAQPSRRASVFLVPTTAGTGSEMTPFATLYDSRRRKVSLDDSCVLAEAVAMVPELLASCPPYVIWCGLLDSIAHAVESLWSLRADDESVVAASLALQAAAPVLIGKVNIASFRGQRLLSESGALAGVAIRITRTTAGHALSYPMTARLGIPHGAAVGIVLRWLIHIVPGHLGAGQCLRATAHAGPCISLGTFLGVSNAREVQHWIDAAIRRTGVLPESIDRAIAQIAEFVHEGFESDRMSGMPIQLKEDDTVARLGMSLREVKALLLTTILDDRVPQGRHDVIGGRS